MSIPVIINGSSYNLPVTGDAAGSWGINLTAVLQALITTSNTLVSPTDILSSSSLIANNQSSPTSISGLSFSPAAVRSAIISYSIYRSTSSAEYSECGQAYITYSSQSNTWEIARSNVGNSGVILSITPAGVVQYVSDNMPGINSAGSMKFSAKTFSL